MLAEKFPKSTFIGFDIDEEAIEAGKATCVEKNLSNLTLLVMDAAKLPQSWNSSYHVVNSFSAKLIPKITHWKCKGGILFEAALNTKTIEMEEIILFPLA